MFRGDGLEHAFASVATRPLTDVGMPKASKKRPDLWCVPIDLGWRIEGTKLDYQKLGGVIAHKSREGLSLSAPGMPQVMAHAMTAPIVLEWFQIYLGQPVALLHRKGDDLVRVDAFSDYRPVARSMGLVADQPAPRLRLVA